MTKLHKSINDVEKWIEKSFFLSLIIREFGDCPRKLIRGNSGQIKYIFIEYIGKLAFVYKRLIDTLKNYMECNAINYY